MKILSLKSENVKRLSVVEIVPSDKGLIIIAGKNGQGKSSVLDSITFALAGGESIQSKPVRKGEDRATMDLDLGEYTVKRTMTAEGGGSLTVRNKDGAKQESPQKILDGLYGALSFDPLEFRNQKPAQRSETLRALLGLDFKTEDEAITKHFDERTIVNRELKAIEARAKALTEYPDAPAEEESAAAIMEEQHKAAATNSANEHKRQATKAAINDADSAATKVTEQKERCLTTEKDIKRLHDLLVIQTRELEKMVKDAEMKLQHSKNLMKVSDALTDIPLTPFVERTKAVEATNAKVRANKSKAELRTQFKEKNKASEALTAKIDAMEKQKRKRIADAKFPVEGLSLSDTKEVLFNGIPFDQASTAEQLKVSVAMGLAMNPKLRVLLIRQGNDLDADNLKLLGEMADKEGAQIWLERVSEGDATVVIEDGMVADRNRKISDAIKAGAFTTSDPTERDE